MYVWSFGIFTFYLEVIYNSITAEYVLWINYLAPALSPLISYPDVSTVAGADFDAGADHILTWIMPILVQDDSYVHKARLSVATSQSPTGPFNLPHAHALAHGLNIMLLLILTMLLLLMIIMNEYQCYWL